MSLYTNIYEYVIDRGYHSITNFCREFSLSPTIFSDLKSGKTQSLSSKNLQAVSEALNVSIDDLVQGAEQDEKILNMQYSDYVSLCQSKNVSTAKVARMAKVSNTTILRWRNGENEPTYASKRKLVDALDNLTWHTPKPFDQSQKLSPVPIYGKIPAGSPVLARQDVIGYGFTDKPNPDEYFFLTVDGDSMEPVIPNKTKVLIKRQSTADDGDIIACIVNGEEATLKRIKYFGANTILLIPENNKYEPITLKTDDFENGTNIILGVVKQCVKDV